MKRFVSFVGFVVVWIVVVVNSSIRNSSFIALTNGKIFFDCRLFFRQNSPWKSSISNVHIIAPPKPSRLTYWHYKNPNNLHDNQRWLVLYFEHSLDHHIQSMIHLWNWWEFDDLYANNVCNLLLILFYISKSNWSMEFHWMRWIITSK